MASISPVFKEFISISLLAMTMSTADSHLNACAVIVSHDIVESVRGVNKVPKSHQFRLAKLTALMVGLFAMMLAFYCNDLLKLSFALSVPIVTAPFILAVFGFRGTSPTALIGMATGILTIVVWNQWIEPTTEIDGSFPCMLANGLAMMAAHYLLPQPEGKGWVEPDDHFKQVQQAKARKKSHRKEAFKNGFINV
jgi:Na+/proline symporter